MPIIAEQRASPEALLALAKKEGRGRLKIFLGAAPGVGKTYAMLQAAREEKAHGRDVVAGLVETHGRRETEALVAGFEVLPRQHIAYQQRVMREFDLDGALARRPGLLLVDEYAHTNVPGARHPKRWQDVDELVAAGIDVWTTLNVQHLESLNDVIQKITHVRVRETVPDTVFEDADEIVLVDFPPDELLKRLAEGKVYVQDTAARAVEGFFKPQNLTALRELALRRAAERIDTSLVGQMQAQAIEGPWPAGERILACVGTAPSASTVVRTAKRLADTMDAPWLAVVIERPSLPLTDAQRKNADEALALAKSLGAETRTLIANDLPIEILKLAKFENATQIVIGRAERPLFARPFQRTLANELVRQAEDIAIHIITGRREGKRWARPGLAAPVNFTPFLWSGLIIAGAALLAKGLMVITVFPNVSLVFLLGVLFCAARFGMWAGIFGSLLAFLTYNFFFIEPLYTFTIAQPHEVLALFVFLAIAAITSTMAGRLRDQTSAAVARMRATRRLFEFTRRLSDLPTLDMISEAAASEIYSSLSQQTVILLAEGGELKLRAAWPPEDELNTSSMTAADWAFTHDEPAGARTNTLPTAPWLFLPLRTPRARVGVLGVAQPPSEGSLDAEARALLDTLVEQTAAALERAAFAQEAVAARTSVETERVRNTLLASISHDFRTPLASILGSTTSVLEYGDQLDTETKRDLMEQVRDEAQRLDEMVRNLLSIARIDAGALELHVDWIDLRDIVERVVNLARRRGARQRIRTDLPADLPLVMADATLVEQAIGNIVENALTHTPQETEIVVDGVCTSDTVTLRITDSGPGFPADFSARLFEKFTRGDARVAASEQRSGRGAGLGLAIAKGIMEAHGGSISAESPAVNGKGARFSLNFPREEQPQ
ncbi:MAG: sensor histidine kinase KdpD [Parvularculaceae bacterium]